MDESELEQIRQARLAQLKSQGGGTGVGAAGAAGAGPGTAGQQQQQQDEEEARRRSILDQILHPEAADRLGRIRLVNQDRAAEVESRLIGLAQTGKLRQKVTEEQLKQFLSAVADKKRQEDSEKIVVQRRKGWGGDDDSDLDDVLGA